MIVSNVTPQRATLVAVDIAKNYHDVLIQRPPLGRRRRMCCTSSEPIGQVGNGIKRGSGSICIEVEAAVC